MKTYIVEIPEFLILFSRDIIVLTCSKWTVWPVLVQKRFKKYKADIPNSHIPTLALLVLFSRLFVALKMYLNHCS